MFGVSSGVTVANFSASMSAVPIPSLSGPADHTIFSDDAGRTRLERDILPGYVSTARWFGGKARVPQEWSIRDVVPINFAADAARFVFLEISYAEGAPDTYLLPLQIASAETAAEFPPAAIVARFADGAVLFDALHDEPFRGALFELIIQGRRLSGASGEIAGATGAILAQTTAAPPSRVLAVEQSNSSIIYGDQIFLKLYRRLELGENPDAEILRFLGDQRFPHVPPFGGAVEYHNAGGERQVLALALGLVPNDGDAWSFTLRHLSRFYDRILADDRAAAAQTEAEYLVSVAQLGTRTGELHRALAADATTPAFAPEPFAQADGDALAAALRVALDEVRTLLTDRWSALDPDAQALVEQLRDTEPNLRARAAAFAGLNTSAAKTRTHGDYHLGQVLHGPDGFLIIDFEGEPLRPLAERRRKMSPFRDVAGMLRSFHYAAYAALEPLGGERERLTADAETWARRAQHTFLEAWRAATTGAVFRDSDPTVERALLDAFLLEKALYEIRYEANNRPAWLGIPVRGVLGL
jgi:maltose alpha-D-glucosyltransferase/alpha-amylase